MMDYGLNSLGDTNLGYFSHAVGGFSPETVATWLLLLLFEVT